MLIYLFIYLLGAKHEEIWADVERMCRSRTILRGNLFYIKCCIKKCTVNKIFFMTCCTAFLDFMFHGCLLVEGFVAVRRFRQAEDVLVGDNGLVALCWVEV